ncbi:hypothetical protein AGMMS50229_21070 [Campylobacterota bacterium]|nr:hypothetical protein AGMMS50229_21070 [Campylobacterota bacterium]
MTGRKIQYWVIPPKSNGEFVAGMENVLEIYGLPRNPNIPVIMMDEQPVQLFKETGTPIAATQNHVRRVDYEYEWAGVANIFMFTEPLGCWRRVAVRERKTKVDWILEARILLEEDYPNVEKIILICDNLNTHSLGAFYETLEPNHAGALARRLEIVPTAKPWKLLEHRGKRVVGFDGPVREGTPFRND